MTGVAIKEMVTLAPRVRPARVDKAFQPSEERTRDQAPPGQPHPWLRFLPFADDEVLRAPEMVLDDVMCALQIVLTGDRGAGKSTVAITMAMLVAHLCPRDHPLRPKLRRNVVFISEDPGQAQWIMRALTRRWGAAVPFYLDDVRERIKFVQATRLHASELEGLAEELCALAVENVGSDGTTFMALPLVILDTRNACISVSEENDNAEASAALGLLREHVPVPTLLIAHPAKGNVRTTRGAGAWEADVQQVIYLSLDPTSRVRTVHLAPDAERDAKRRFESDIHSLVISSDVVTFESRDVLGNVVPTKVRYVDVAPEGWAQKKARADDALELRILAAVRDGAASGNAVKTAIGASKPNVLAAIKRLREVGELDERAPVLAGSGRGGNRQRELFCTAPGLARIR